MFLHQKKKKSAVYFILFILYCKMPCTAIEVDMGKVKNRFGGLVRV